MNKKLISMALASAMILSLSSCGGGGSATMNRAADTAAAPEAGDAATAAASPSASAGASPSATAAASPSTSAAAAPATTAAAASEAGDAVKDDSASYGGSDVITAGESISGVSAADGSSAEYIVADREADTASFAPEADYDYYSEDIMPEGMVYEESYDSSEYSWDDTYIVSNQARAGLLTGGEWRDNSNYAFWQRLFSQREDWADTMSDWQLDTTDRVFVRVKGSDSRPAAGLTVKLAAGNTLLWESVTDSRGEAFLFPRIVDRTGITPDKVIVETVTGSAVIMDLSPDYSETDTAFEISVPETDPMRTQLDLMFMIDTTGSMGDELSYIQNELENVINRVSDETQTDIQLSVNFYRDEGDDYVVRDFGFTKNISIALDHLRDQRARGGGDYEEAVEQAIGNALYKHQWRDGSEKLMFLVLDAPPHYQEAVSVLPDLIRKASEMGVRIIPVASSGVDTTTEFLCRCMAMATGGTYTFLTDDSGIGYSHLEPTIGSYEVEKLNDMLVRIISDYFSQASRTSPSQDQGSGSQTGSAGRYSAAYTYTHDYFGGEGYYRTGVITNEDMLAEFEEKYGFDLSSEFRGIDFKRSAIAYCVDMLSSGSIRIDDKAGVYVTIDNGKPVFHYELDIPEIGTTDIMTLFVYSEVPSASLMVSPG